MFATVDFGRKPSYTHAKDDELKDLVIYPYTRIFFLSNSVHVYYQEIAFESKSAQTCEIRFNGTRSADTCFVRAIKKDKKCSRRIFFIMCALECLNK